MQTDEILDLESTGALLSGHFELRSKLHSDRFFQCALLQRHPRLRAPLRRAGRESRPPTSAGSTVHRPALGGIVAYHELARALDLRSVFAEKVDGRLAMRRFAIKPGARYLIAEDVVTRGGRVQETIDLVREGGGKPVAVAVLVDRSAGQADFGMPLFSLLEMAPQVWEPTECPLCKAGQPFVHPGS